MWRKKYHHQEGCPLIPQKGQRATDTSPPASSLHHVDSLPTPPLFIFRHQVHMELCLLREVQRLQLDDIVLLWAVRHVDPLVNDQSIDSAKLVVNMSTQQANVIRTKHHRFGRLIVELFVNFRTFHEVDDLFLAQKTEPVTGGRLLICNDVGFASLRDISCLLLVLKYKTLCTIQRTSAVHHAGSYSV